MQKLVLSVFSLLITCICFAQNDAGITIKVLSDEGAPVQGATVELLKKDSSVVKIQLSDSTGTTSFEKLAANDYLIRITRVGFTPYFSRNPYKATAAPKTGIVNLETGNSNLSNVTVTAKRPFIELQPDKTVVNLDASPTNVGTTALEALEKLPGITIDRDGNISLKGRNNVMVLIDGKQTYLDPAQLSSLLNGMNSSQIAQVEIISNPSAKYDAAGNSGIINIKLKKNRQVGFNGSISSSYGQGRYYKNNNNLQLNYRNGKVNLFLSYSLNANRNYMELYALRTYLDNNGAPVSYLEQPSMMRSKGHTDNLRTGIDYALSTKTNVGVTLSGSMLSRTSIGRGTALWQSPNRTTDSLIETYSNNPTDFKNGGINFNFKHSFNASTELTADVDVLGYRIKGKQFFENALIASSTVSEASRADIPTNINIVSGKADYSRQFRKLKWESGWKSSHITTDNIAAYQYRDGATWKEDYGKSNHFLYEEDIHAVYTNAQTTLKKWSLQGGLRYEMTSYDARQLGNVIVKDSSFSRSYNSLFPSLFVSYAADSVNTFSFMAGRRIDRPVFQKLNPFLFIINKYTYQKGNPYYRPQFTWNTEISHKYKDALITSLTYSVTKDYFSQIFPIDSNGIVLYTEGNLGKLQVFALSTSLQLNPAKWWNLSTNVVYNHKILNATIYADWRRTVNQFTINLNNQFRFKKGWSGELSGFYVSQSQHDIQEVVEPAGQLSVGVSKTVLKNKGTIRLAARDLFHTQWMKGFTLFDGATEYFEMFRDTRVVTLALTYRFGKAFKTNRRSGGAASDEMQRVGTN
jgi:iron complex outermembrane recepter protein